MSTPEEDWYIIKLSDEAPCQIVAAVLLKDMDPLPTEEWGPFKSQNQAIAKRVGLIRAGKCKPA